MDPTLPLPKSDAGGSSWKAASGPATIEDVLAEQLRLAQIIQTRLREEEEELSPREFKDYVTAASAIVGQAHRAEQALQTINTYKLFWSVVMEFLKRRSDELGEDLVAELQLVADDLKAGKDVSALIR